MRLVKWKARRRGMGAFPRMDASVATLSQQLKRAHTRHGVWPATRRLSACEQPELSAAREDLRGWIASGSKATTRSGRERIDSKASRAGCNERWQGHRMLAERS